MFPATLLFYKSWLRLWRAYSGVGLQELGSLVVFNKTPRITLFLDASWPGSGGFHTHTHIDFLWRNSCLPTIWWRICLLAHITYLHVFSGLLCKLIFKDELFQKLSWAQPGSWFSTDIWKFPLCRPSTILDWLLTFTHIYQSFTPKSPIWIRINQLLAHFWAKYRWYMVIPMVIFRWIPGTRYTSS